MDYYCHHFGMDCYFLRSMNSVMHLQVGDSVDCQLSACEIGILFYHFTAVVCTFVFIHSICELCVCVCLFCIRVVLSQVAFIVRQKC